MEQVAVDAYVLDGLLPDLMGHDRRPAALAVYLALYRRGAKAGWMVRMSHQALAGATGLSRSSVQAALAHLQKRQLVVTERKMPTSVPAHRVQRPWMRLVRRTEKP